jgi:hypothetical protein
MKGKKPKSAAIESGNQLVVLFPFLDLNKTLHHISADFLP